MNVKEIAGKKIILGSTSPRRKQLLAEAGFVFEVRTADTDENFDPSMNVYEVASHLAKRKALALRHTLRSDEILVTADSVVILDNRIYGKPVDDKDAFRIIHELAGHCHTVVTGVCVMTLDEKIVFDDRTEVCFASMAPEEIQYYVDKYKPLDKAGSYGIQDWIGLCKVRSIHGSYANVMGLPVHRLYEVLMGFHV
jgi:septum formation protein